MAKKILVLRILIDQLLKIVEDLNRAWD